MKNNAAYIEIITAQLTLMSLMLFLSNCSLRFSLKSTFDLSNPSVSHKRNIQEPQAADCCSFDVESTISTKASFQFEHDQILALESQADISLNKAVLKDLPVVKPLQWKSIPKPVPLYILYQNMKCFIS